MRFYTQNVKKDHRACVGLFGERAADSSLCPVVVSSNDTARRVGIILAATSLSYPMVHVCFVRTVYRALLLLPH